MVDQSDKSIGHDATFDGAAKPPASSRDASLGDERTLRGGGIAIDDTLLDDIEIVDLDARYKVEAGLGEGGMGAVVLATDTRLGRKVAIKRILGEAVRSKAAIARFLTEARAIAAISHPNVVQIFELGVAEAGPFLVIEYIDGGSLLDRCKAGPIPLEEAVAIVCQICDGLARAHDAGIIHRDIKPANILLTKDGVPKLTDFGLAKAEAADHQMTMTGAVMGTPDFMPPEQRRDAALVDHRSDLWSLAATLYQAVTGRSPKVIRLDLVPPDLAQVLGRALEEEKDARYQSAKAFREELKGAGRGTRKPAGPPQFEGVLQEGQCKACGTVTSDLSKKFCRNPQCGASLRVPCLKCDSQMPVWDGVCGECGGNQSILLEARRKTLESKRAEAESLLADLAFEEAIACAQDVASDSHAALADLAEWAVSFIASTIAERDRQRALAAERLKDARKHAAAFDYPAAIQAMEMIPKRLHDATTNTLLAHCRARHHESDRLIEEISGRIANKELDGLLPMVERAAELRGDRHDLVKIRHQLQERWHGRLEAARAEFKAGNAATATSLLAKMASEESGDSAAVQGRARILAFLNQAMSDAEQRAADERSKLAYQRQALAAQIDLAWKRETDGLKEDLQFTRVESEQVLKAIRAERRRQQLRSKESLAKIAAAIDQAESRALAFLAVIQRGPATELRPVRDREPLPAGPDDTAQLLQLRKDVDEALTKLLNMVASVFSTWLMAIATGLPIIFAAIAARGVFIVSENKLSLPTRAAEAIGVLLLFGGGGAISAWLLIVQKRRSAIRQALAMWDELAATIARARSCHAACADGQHRRHALDADVAELELTERVRQSHAAFEARVAALREKRRKSLIELDSKYVSTEQAIEQRRIACLESSESIRLRVS